MGVVGEEAGPYLGRCNFSPTQDRQRQYGLPSGKALQLRSPRALQYITVRRGPGLKLALLLGVLKNVDQLPSGAKFGVFGGDERLENVHALPDPSPASYRRNNAVEPLLLP